MDNMEEMNKFLERYNLPRLKEEEIEKQTDQPQVMKLKLQFKIF